MTRYADEGALLCPACGNAVSLRVIESRPVPDQQAIRRRRRCSGCGYRFTTKERVDDQPVPRDGVKPAIQALERAVEELKRKIA